jgi:hypothetical protein
MSVTNSISIATFIDWKGSLLPILLKPEDSLSDIKKKIYVKTGIDVNHQKLVASQLSRNAPKMSGSLKSQWFQQETCKPMSSVKYFILKDIRGL